jgi:hypothetical protein
VKDAHGIREAPGVEGLNPPPTFPGSSIAPYIPRMRIGVMALRDLE